MNIKRQMMYCPHDKKSTLHYKDCSKVNWPLHIILTLLTGFWIIFCLYFALTSNFKCYWVCSECGDVHK